MVLAGAIATLIVDGPWDPWAIVLGLTLVVVLGAFFPKEGTLSFWHCLAYGSAAAMCAVLLAGWPAQAWSSGQARRIAEVPPWLEAGKPPIASFRSVPEYARAVDDYRTAEEGYDALIEAMARPARGTALFAVWIGTHLGVTALVWRVRDRDLARGPPATDHPGPPSRHVGPPSAIGAVGAMGPPAGGEATG